VEMPVERHDGADTKFGRVGKNHWLGNGHRHDVRNKKSPIKLVIQCLPPAQARCLLARPLQHRISMLFVRQGCQHQMNEHLLVPGTDGARPSERVPVPETE
jgi:hypothetical protein